MASRYWARHWISGALAVLLSACASAQAFGRFGFTSWPAAPGFGLEHTGFRADWAASDSFTFVKPLDSLSPAMVGATQGLYVGTRFAGNPEKVSVNLFAPGFELFFPLGAEFRMSSLASPYLSWGEGSVGAEVPTPDSPWVLVSFLDAQPPVLLSFPERPARLRVTGQAGDWRIATEPSFSGWVRVTLPLGARPRPATTASDLAAIVAEVRKHEKFWLGRGAALKSVEVKPGEEDLTAIWTFDGVGVPVPVAALMAKQGGYAVDILSGIARTDADLPEGPVAYTTEPKLVIRLPMRRIANGRPVGFGITPTLAQLANPFDLASVTELALATLFAARPESTLLAASEAKDAFLRDAVVATEPVTSQRLPFQPSGQGADLAAAHALLTQALLSTEGRDSSANTLFTNVAWRRDWTTWKIWSDDADVGRRAAALLAVAGSLCHEPERRLEAAMLQSSLAAERALRLYRQRRGFPVQEGRLIEPLFGLRRGIFLTQPEPAGEDPFVAMLRSELRVMSDVAVSARQTDEGIALRWLHKSGQPKTLILATGWPASATARSNIAAITTQESLGFLVIRYEPKEEGYCEVVVRAPGWTKPLPAIVPAPRYTE